MADNAYAASYYFKLSFKGDEDAFQEVTGISKELNIEEVVCGGENRFKYRLPTTASSQNLVLKRAFITKGSKLVNWCASSVDGNLIKQIEPHDVSISLLDAGGIVCAMWTFYKAYPVKYAISDLKSQESGLVIESMELAYTYFAVSKSIKFNGLF